MHGCWESKKKSWAVKVFLVFSWNSSFYRSRIFTWRQFLFYIHGTSGSHLLKTLSLCLIFFPLVCVCCRPLTTSYDVPDCESTFVMPVMSWPRLCESASSCSAICPGPGSLIREESCGKVCVSLPVVPLSLQMFVREGPQQQHRGAGDHYITAGVWSRHCWRLESFQGTPDTDTQPRRIHLHIYFYFKWMYSVSRA